MKLNKGCKACGQSDVIVTESIKTFKIDSLGIGRGNPNWGAPTDRGVFIIKLGKRI